MTIRRALTVLVVVAGVGLAACSDDETISKQDFIEQANAECSAFDDTLAEAQADLGTEPTEEEVTAFLTEVFVPELRSTTAAIRDLGFPEGDEERLDRLMTETDEILDTVTDDPATALRAEESPFASVNAELSDYGLTVCGDG